MIRSLGRDRPRVPSNAFVHSSAEVIGAVRLGLETSIWPGAVVRGDIEEIRIGNRSNIQDNAVLHTDRGLPTVVGRNVTVGHGAILHSCRIGDDSLVGMGAMVLSGAVVGKGALVGAGTLVPPYMRIPAGYLAVGSPARVVRALTNKEKFEIKKNARRYLAYAHRHSQDSKIVI